MSSPHSSSAQLLPASQPRCAITLPFVLRLPRGIVPSFCRSEPAHRLGSLRRSKHEAISQRVVLQQAAILSLSTTSSSLNSLFRVLCIFPLRYLFAIGLSFLFSLRWSIPPALGCTLKQPDSPSPSSLSSVWIWPGHWPLRGCHPLCRLVPKDLQPCCSGPTLDGPPDYISSSVPSTQDRSLMAHLLDSDLGSSLFTRRY